MAALPARRQDIDFIFLAEGLRLREQRGLLHDLDYAETAEDFWSSGGRPKAKRPADRKRKTSSSR